MLWPHVVKSFVKIHTPIFTSLFLLQNFFMGLRYIQMVIAQPRVGMEWVKGEDKRDFTEIS